MTDYIKAVITTLVSLATFAANIPVIFVTFRSRRFENDSVAKLIASLAVSDIVNGVMAGCCAGVAWSLQPGEQVPTWLLRLINSGMYTLGMCSLCHLAAVSVVKCTVIVRPLTHFTIFTDRVLRAVITSIWTVSLTLGGATNVGVTEESFNWITMMTRLKRQNTFFGDAFMGVTFITATIIVMAAYIKVFLVVRRHVRSLPTDVLESFGTTTIFGPSVRSAKNLFVICVAYWSSYLPIMVRIALRAKGIEITGAVLFAVSWIYMSSSAVNGFLYIVLHSYVRHELYRYIPHCHRRAASVAPVGVVERQQPCGCVNPSAEVLVMTLSGHIPTVTL